MVLDGSQATFEVAIKDDLTFETYIGTFRVKCFLSPIDMIKADRLYRELIGAVSPMMASNAVQSMTFAISQLSVRVLEAPDFFRLKSELPGGHLTDNVLSEILGLAIEAEDLYRKQQKDKFDAIQKRLQTKFEKGTIKKIEPDQEEAEVSNGDKEEEIDLE